MKHYITEKDWEALESLLMKAEIPIMFLLILMCMKTWNTLPMTNTFVFEPIVIQKKEKIV